MDSKEMEFSSEVIPQQKVTSKDTTINDVETSAQWKNLSVIIACGLLFGAGLSLSGMADPSKVIDFLKMGPDAGWDPSLALVMGGAVFVTGIVFPYVLGWKKPLMESKFSLPTKTQVDSRLIAGACLFGLGWGLAGICPGPGLVGLVHGAPSGAVFVATLIIGMFVHDKFVPQ